MILLLDNYDSFVHNLARYLRRLGQPTRVVRSDAITVEECAALAPLGIVISPGPRRPEEAGCSVDVIRQLGASTPILGVCLGHQAIGVAFGAVVTRCDGVHGRGSEIEHDGTGVFAGLRNPMRVGRYHSLAIDESTIGGDLIVTSRTIGTAVGSPVGTACESPVIMSVRHRTLPIHGVQFHPESVLSEDGADVLANFLGLAFAWHGGDRKLEQADEPMRVAS